MSGCPFSRLLGSSAGEAQPRRATCPIPQGDRSKWHDAGHAAVPPEPQGSMEQNPKENGPMSCTEDFRGYLQEENAQELRSDAVDEGAPKTQLNPETEQARDLVEADGRTKEAKCPFRHGSAAVNKLKKSARTEQSMAEQSDNGDERKTEAKCPFEHGSTVSSTTDESIATEQGMAGESAEGDGRKTEAKCPFGHGSTVPSKTDDSTATEQGVAGKSAEGDGRKTEAKCPFGFDAASFKIGPLSCVICKALLFDTCRIVPCRHIFCRGCVSRFKDCPICGADVENLEPDRELQSMVDRYIEGHGRIHRSNIDPQSDGGQSPANDLAALDTRIYEEGSLERGGFLLQQAMRAFQAGNLASAKHRLQICLEDAREELARTGGASRAVICQLGAILGVLGDCCRMMGDVEEAGEHYRASAEFLAGVEERDAEVVHALSVSLNKQGDLRYYAGDLSSARDFYRRALTVRRAAVGEKGEAAEPSQVLDLAVSLAKVADLDRTLGDEAAARDGFSRAALVAEQAKISEEHPNEALANRKASTLDFIRAQI